MNFGWRISFIYNARSGDDYVKLGNIINSLSNDGKDVFYSREDKKNPLIMM